MSAGPDMQRRNEDSWIDAIVTLLATIVFGLGWVLVELERADPPPNRYDAAVSTAWTTAVTSSIQARATQARETEARETRSGRAAERDDADEAWTKLAQRSSRRNSNR